MPHFYPLQNMEKNRLALLPKSFKPPVPLKKHEWNWKFPWFSKIPPEKKGWHLHHHKNRRAPPRKFSCEKFHSRWTIAGVGEVASVFYTVLLGTKEPPGDWPHGWWPIFGWREISNSFFRVNMSILRREFLPFCFEHYAISGFGWPWGNFWYGCSFEGIMEGIMEPEKPRCDFVGCMKNTGNLICQVIGSESVD